MKYDDLRANLAGREPGILDGDQVRKYAILVPLVEKEDGLHVLFEVRSSRMRKQPGDVCFPGGRIEQDDSTEEKAAIRETIEELGILAAEIGDVYPLDYLVGDIHVYPFAGRLLFPDRIQVNPDEVEEIFTVPLNYLLEKEPIVHYVDLLPTPAADFPYEWIQGGVGYQWRPRKTPQLFYLYEDRVIWGLTAQILHHFLQLIRHPKPSSLQGD